jgi:hypothetical protein
MPKTKTARQAQQAQQTPPSDLRDALSRKRRPSRTYRMLLTDPQEAQTALEEAQAQARIVFLRQEAGSPDREAAEAEVLAAKRKLEACWHKVVLRGISAQRFTDLVAKHPPTRDGKLDGDQWNPETFQPALIAACAEDSDMTEQEWAAELDSDRWPLGERNALFAEALALNVGTR